MRTAWPLNATCSPALPAGVSEYPVVGILTPGYPASSSSNGISIYTAGLVKGMRAVGVRPNILAGEITGPVDDIPVVQVPDWDREHSRFQRVLERIGRRLAPEVLHDRTWAESIICGVRRLQHQAGIQIFEMEESFGLARYLARRVSIPIVVRLHGPWFIVGPLAGHPRDHGYRQRVRNERAGLLSAAAVSAPSRDVINRARAYYGIELSDAEVIPNAAPPVAPEQRWSLGACDPNRILFVGRFDRVKGADVLLKAFALMLTQRPEARLTMVGPEQTILDEYGIQCTRADMLNRYLPGSAQGSVEWLGFLPHAKVQALRKRCAMTVVSSRYETFSMTALEAMSAGCPLVATDVGGLPEMLQHERNSLLCRSEDAAEMAAMILQVLRQPRLAETIGRQALLDAERRYNPAAIARHTLEFYKRVVERHVARAAAYRYRRA